MPQSALVTYCGGMRSVREGRTSSISGNGDRPRHRRGIHKIKKVREKARQRRALDLTWRVGVFMVGAAVIVAGLVMLITPGPGVIVIILGLAILASEYVWAQHLLERARTKARQAADKAFDPKRRRRNQIILVITGVLVAVAAGLYWQAYGFAFAPWLGGE